MTCFLDKFVKHILPELNHARPFKQVVGTCKNSPQETRMFADTAEKIREHRLDWHSSTPWLLGGDQAAWRVRRQQPRNSRPVTKKGEL